MNTKIILLGIMLFALANSANAFPLTGGNGEINATVVGTYRSINDVIVVDIISSDSIDAVLVDADDKFHQAETNHYTADVGYYGSDRTLYVYDLPKDVEIKRVRITPRRVGANPFSIEWKGVPEVNSAPLSMKFYGLQSVFNLPKEDEYQGSYDADQEINNNVWNADIKFTNTGNDPLEIDTGDFEIIDQFGFHYLAKEWGIVTEKLMPAESMRFTIGFEDISKLSRPIYILYKPYNIKMDISAWS